MFENLLPQDYEYFKQTVADVRTAAIRVPCLGTGKESQVFEIAVDGRYYALKFANRFTVLDRPRNIPRAIQRKIDAGFRGLNLSGLEQIQSASIEEGVVIYKRAKGKMVKSMSNAELNGVTEEQYTSFRRTVYKAVEVGIEFDPWNQDGSNVLYDQETGFTLIDYFVDYAKTPPEQSRQNGLKALGAAGIVLTQRYDEA